MDKVTFIKVETVSGVQEMAQIEHADGSFTSMTKSEYDKRQAEQSTPIVIDETETK
jgi:hypothetical protein